jgi:hypothetical protein
MNAHLRAAAPVAAIGWLLSLKPMLEAAEASFVGRIAARDAALSVTELQRLQRLRDLVENREGGAA